jgi:hypothetical protein
MKSSKHPSRKSWNVTNTTSPVRNDGIPREPYERDESPDQEAPKPREKIKQAYKDLQNGQVDTDLRGESGVDAVVNPQNIPSEQVQKSDKD